MSEQLETLETPARANRLPINVRLLGISFALLVMVIAVALWGERQASLYAEAAFATQNRELETLRRLSLLQDAETGQRGFLLTEDKAFLAPYEGAIGEIAKIRGSFKGLIIDDLVAQDRAASLDQLIAERLELLARPIALLNDGDRQSAVEMVKAGEGKARMDEIRAFVDLLNGVREKLLADQQSRLRQTSR